MYIAKVMEITVLYILTVVAPITRKYINEKSTKTRL